jgi:hypothetical protein
MTFATTGCDSVHYSYLVDERLPDSVCPIVMTLPCVNELSWVIAENFQEFFDYGYYTGWLEPEQLYYEDEKGEACFHEASQSLNTRRGAAAAAAARGVEYAGCAADAATLWRAAEKVPSPIEYSPMPPEHA